MLQRTGSVAMNAQEPAVGWQCIVDLHDCETRFIDDPDWVRVVMLEAARRAEAHVVSDAFHQFEPYGISGFVMIGESHLAVHIWPERKFAAIDVFTCNAALKTQAAVEYLIDAFGARRPAGATFARGDERVDFSCDALPGGRQTGFAFGAGLRNTTGQPDAAKEDEVSSTGNDDLYIDRDDDSAGHWFVCRRTVTDVQTVFQSAEILEFAGLGRALILDGEIQSVEADEYLYHEALVQPAMCIHPRPARILVIGGGEGAVAREVLKHACVERCVMVDIDGDVIDLARAHLPSWHDGAFADPRLQIVIGDGLDYVSDSEETFDIVIVDLVSSMDGGPAEKLYTEGFYGAVSRRLAAGGIAVVQGVECHVGACDDHVRVRSNLAEAFRHVRSYAAFVPSFTCPWGFLIASDTRDAGAVAAEAIDNTILERGLAAELRFYDGTTHRGLFSMPKDLRRLLGEF